MKIPVAAAAVLIWSLSVLPSTPDASTATGGPAGPKQAISLDAVQKTGPQSYRVGAIRIDAAAREICFPAKVNMDEGLIEVVLCTEEGKLHESVFVTAILPMHLHVALVLLGLRPGGNPGWHMPEDPAFRPTGWDRPPGDRVDVYARWDTPKGRQQVRAESLLMDERTGRPLPHTSWLFVGSWINSVGAYAADEFGSIVTNYHDPTTVIDNPLEAGQVDDFTFANTAVIPDVGTAVEIRIVPAEPQKEKLQK